MFPGAVRFHQAHEERWEVAKDLDLLLMGVHRLLEEVEGDLRRGVGFRQPGANAGAAFLGQWAADAAGHSPRGMDLLAAEHRNDFLAELAQPNAGAGQLGIGGNQPEDVPLGLRRVPAEQKIRSAQVKEAQGMALDDLAEVHQPAQLVRGGRDVDGHDGVTRLGRREQMADGADAADARGNAGHLAVGTALAELLEPAELNYVKLGVRHIAGVVHEYADLGVPLDAGHWINDDALAHNYPNFSCGPSSFGSSLLSTCTSRALMRSAGGGQPGRK